MVIFSIVQEPWVGERPSEWDPGTGSGSGAQEASWASLEEVGMASWA